MNRSLTAVLLLSACLSISGHESRAVSAAKVSAIVGWPVISFGQGDRPPEWLGNDPVLGRLICPPFSRLNLLRQVSEGLFFQDVVVSGGNAQPFVWTFSQRLGLFWWDGSKVTPSDLSDFLTRELAGQVQKKSGGIWKVPAFSTRIKNDALEVLWKEAPVFGPWILDGLSFFRPDKSGKPGFECAGIYRARFAKEGVWLSPSESYGLGKENFFFTDSPESLPDKNMPVTYRFKMGDSLSVDPAVRPPDLDPGCKNLADVPYASIISWNLKRERMNQVALRQALTGLTPRGALLRAGAGFQGELISSLIPRNHPGYQSRVYVREFDLEKASGVLNQLGYVRPRGDSMRVDSRKNPLTLTLASVSQEPGILEKVIADSFMAVGIRTHYLKGAEKTGFADVDGVVTGVWLDWPEMNFMSDFHSKSHPEPPFWSPGDSSLDQELEAYALSLSQGKPDFQALGKVHKLLYNLEPVTVLMQHKVCLEAKNPQAFSADSRDPDWFRKLIL